MLSQTELSSDGLLKVLLDYAEYRWNISEVGDSWSCPVKEYAYIWVRKDIDCVELAWDKENKEYVLTVVGLHQAGKYSLETDCIEEISIDKLDKAFAQARVDGYKFV